jgi:hypothetical protein
MTLTDYRRIPPSARVRHAGGPLVWGIPPLALCCGIGLAALTYLERISGGSLFLAVFLFSLLVLAALIAAGVDFVKRRPMRAAVLLLAPFLLAFPVLYSPFLEYEYYVLDLLRFQLSKEKYSEVIDKLSSDERASRIVAFRWGAQGMVPSSTDEFWLVYDESGEIARPQEERSVAWKDKAAKQVSYFSDGQCITKGYRLSGHYYSAEVTCLY